jgi:hypothetical protein
MARRTASRMELRRQAEAADAAGTPAAPAEEAAPKAKKAAAKKKAAPRSRRVKTRAQVRKRLVWGVFSSSMKEEGRFLYAERELADQKALALAEKHKRKFFVQPIKEIIGEKPVDYVEDDAFEDEKPVRAKKKKKAEDEEDDSSGSDGGDFEMPDFGDDDDD